MLCAITRTHLHKNENLGLNNRKRETESHEHKQNRWQHIILENNMSAEQAKFTSILVHSTRWHVKMLQQLLKILQLTN